jgi:DNA primase
MTINELKEYIYENNKIQDILEALGCHEIKYNAQREYWSATQPDGDNPMGVVIRNNQYLSYRSFSRGVDYEDGKDLISLIETIKKLSFVESVKYLHKILELPFEFKKKEEKPKKKYDPLSVFKKVLRCNRRVVDVADIQILEDKLLNDFVPMLHISWLKQGITERTRKKFGLCYSYRHKRVVIPMKYWATGELLGFNQRTVIENYKEFGIKKYFLTPTYPKQLNLYGLYENYDSIQKAGYVVVYEAEKSVLKRDSLNDPTGVALSGHTLSDEQVRILIGLNVEVVIAYDKDICIDEVRHACEKFKNIRKVSYIKDSWGILNDKDSPADARNKDYQFLFDNRIVYDREEQRKYQESLRK